MSEADYEAFAAAIHAAGFFTNGVEPKDGWDRTTVYSEGPRVLGGNSFWVTTLPSGWYVGAWGGLVYRIAGPDRITAFCIAWLQRQSRLVSDFSADIKSEFGLIQIDEEEFDRVSGRTGEVDSR